MNIKRLITLLPLIGIALSGGMSAQNLILDVDGSPCSVPITSASVDFAANGDVTVGATESSLQTCVPGAVAGAPVVSLVVTPGTINSGDTVGVSWTITNYVQGLTACTTSGGTAAWVAEDIAASTNVSGAGSAGTYSPTLDPTNFSMSCTNGSGSDTASVVVNGGGGGGGLDPDPALMCSTNQPPPLGVTRQNPFTVGAISAVEFSDVWGDWPGGGVNQNVQVPRDKYVAIPFITNTNGFMGMLWFVNPNSSLGSSVTISRCPGDFNTAAFTDPQCFAGGNGGEIRAQVSQTAGSVCNLLPDTLYFLNVGDFAANTDNPNSFCQSPICVFQAAP